MNTLSIAVAERIKTSESLGRDVVLSIHVLDLVTVFEGCVFFAKQLYRRMAQRFKSIRGDLFRCLEQLKAVLSTEQFASRFDARTLFYIGKAGVFSSTSAFCFDGGS